MRNATADDLRKMLRKRVSASPSAASVAAEFGISQSYLTELLKGTRRINGRIAELLGYEEIVAYRKKKDSEARVA